MPSVESASTTVVVAALAVRVVKNKKLNIYKKKAEKMDIPRNGNVHWYILHLLKYYSTVLLFFDLYAHYTILIPLSLSLLFFLY